MSVYDLSIFAIYLRDIQKLARFELRSEIPFTLLHYFAYHNK